MDEVNKVIIWGIVGMTLIVLLFMGPGMWSSSTSWPLIDRAVQWFKRKPGGGEEPKDPPSPSA